jgi:hypothetical protein
MHHMHATHTQRANPRDWPPAFMNNIVHHMLGTLTPLPARGHASCTHNTRRHMYRHIHTFIMSA